MVRKALTAMTGALGALSVVACGGQSGSIPSSGAREPTYTLQANELRPMSLQLGGVSAADRETVLFSFGGQSGTNPAASLINVGGVLYGTTQTGGAAGAGTVYKITTSGTETIVHSFASAGDGAFPVASLIDINGVLYGTTTGGGAHNAGTVFKITPSGTESVLYSFAGGSDGDSPTSLIDVGGVLYGTTSSGGAHGTKGTVFTLTMSGTESVLHSFGGERDGGNPTASLTNVDGVLYGTTEIGGTNGNGTVFKITTSGLETVIYRFKGGSDGGGATADLTEVNGALYGTCYAGGDSSGDGTVFKVTTSGIESVVYRFKGGNDGDNPFAGVTNVNGVLYGTTNNGGVNDKGTVYSLSL